MFLDLYIHDSKTNVTQGPYRLKGSFYSDLSLVYGPNAEVSGPRFGILTQPGCHMAFDLRSVNSNSTLTTFQVPNNAVAAGNLKEYEFLIPCDGFCTALQSTELLSVGVGVSMLNLIFVILLLRHRILKKRGLREGVFSSIHGRNNSPPGR